MADTASKNNPPKIPPNPYFSDTQSSPVRASPRPSRTGGVVAVGWAVATMAHRAMTRMTVFILASQEFYCVGSVEPSPFRIFFFVNRFDHPKRKSVNRCRYRRTRAIPCGKPGEWLLIDDDVFFGLLINPGDNGTGVEGLSGFCCPVCRPPPRPLANHAHGRARACGVVHSLSF